VIGGMLKRSKLAVPDRPGLRPTPDRVRETLFNWLAADLHGARVLDLCAGTGVLGIEAISRGAAYAWLNEPDGELADQIIRNCERLGIAGQVQVSRLAAERLLAAASGERFDIAFVDPPYDARMWAPILDGLPGWLAPAARVYLEHPAETGSPLTPAWRVLKESRAGRVHFYLLEQAASSASLSGETTAESAP
jgi:16S rRNA (guanine966-N2)-methyltransferase